jgi:RNA polymerase sigma-70 factor, ECF subfamily
VFTSSQREIALFYNPKRLRRPEERVGTLSNAALPPPSTDSAEADDAVVGSLRRGDERAYAKLIDQYHVPMLHIALNHVRSRDEAEEVIQDTWLAVISGIDRFEERSSFKTWLFRILMNRARTRATRESRTIPFSAFTGAPSRASSRSELECAFEAAVPVWAGSDQARTPEDRLLSAELTNRIHEAIATLPAVQQTVLTLRDLEGWSAREVCSKLAMTETNQRVQLHRARSRVRNALTSYIDGTVAANRQLSGEAIREKGDRAWRGAA